MSRTITLRSGKLALDIACASGKLVSLRYERDYECGYERESDFENFETMAPTTELFVACTAPELEDTLSLRNKGKSTFDCAEAWGSDECFPSVGASQKPTVRDHGWLWGQRAEVSLGDEGVALSRWLLPDGQTFVRRVTSLFLPQGSQAVGAFLFEVDYPVHCFVEEDSGTSPKSGINTDPFESPSVNPAEKPCLRLKSVYASHALFEANTGDELNVYSVPCTPDMLSGTDAAMIPKESLLLWSEIFPAPELHMAQKFFAEALPGHTVWTRLRKAQLGIDVIVSQVNLPHVGIWWCNNGWGDGRPHRTIGIEPTNAAADGPLFTGGLDGNFIEAGTSANEQRIIEKNNENKKDNKNSRRAKAVFRYTVVRIAPSSPT